jgi:putative transposase
MLPEMSLAPQDVRTYLITAVAADRRRIFQVEARAELLISTMQDYRQKRKFELYSFVVMPDHVHLLLTPAPDVPLEKAVQFIKGGFSFRLKSKLDVWQRGYDNRRIVDGYAYDAAVGYIEQNPVRARLVEQAEEFMYSSAGGKASVDPRPAWF